MTGRVFAVVGPSGVGKDTLLSGAVAASPALHWARRTITRPDSPGTEPYEGVPPAEFDFLSNSGVFALEWPAHGLRYGIRTLPQPNRIAHQRAVHGAGRPSRRPWPRVGDRD